MVSLEDRKPYIPPSTSMVEFSFKAIVLGVLLSVIMGAANAYLGMYAGMTVSASIPAAVVSMAVLRLFKDKNILENNMVQTAASSGESLAAGVIFTVPALIVLGAYELLPYWLVTVMAALGGALGALLTVILRRAFIVEEKLPYPEGKACAEVLIAGDKGGSHALPIFQGGIIGAVYKFLGSIGLWGGSVETAGTIGSGLAYFGMDLSTALIAVGYIVGFNIAFLIFIGGAIGWFIGIPVLTSGMASDSMTMGEIISATGTVWSSQIRYMGVGAMVVGGLWSLIKLRKPITRGMSAGMSMVRKKQGGALLPRTEEDLPLNIVLTLIVAFVVPLFLLYYNIIGILGTAVVAAIVMLILSFFGSSIAGYLAGIVGSSNNPVSGITIMSLLFTALMLKALGLSGSLGMTSTILVAGVICMAAAIAGDTMQDLATGYMVGATPKRQQIFEIMGTVSAALVMAPILNLLIRAYGIAGTASATENALPAPQAFLMASVTRGVFEGTLNWTMVYVGAGLAILLIIFDEILAAKGSNFRTPVMPVAVGLYLPFSLGVAIFFGGILNSLSRKLRRGKNESTNDIGVLGAAGLITGEALMGIGFAIMIVSGVSLKVGLTSSGLGLILLLAIAYWLVRLGKK